MFLHVIYISKKLQKIKFGQIWQKQEFSLNHRCDFASVVLSPFSL